MIPPGSPGALQAKACKAFFIPAFNTTIQRTGLPVLTIAHLLSIPDIRYCPTHLELRTCGGCISTLNTIEFVVQSSGASMP
jgi:hypothetical protein